MIISKLSGGIGNQMFQYAFARSIQLKHHTRFKADTSWYNEPERNEHERFLINIFPNINLRKASKEDIFFFRRKTLYGSSLLYKIVCNILNSINIEEKQFNFDSKLKKNSSRNSYIKGYWQSEKYFLEIRNKLINDFTFPELNKKSVLVKDKITNSNSCSLHIRRGDYINKPLYSKNHGFLGLEYYKNAINKMQQKENNLSLFVFSDDIKWVKENLNTNIQTSYIDWNIGTDAIHDMHLMSLCKHNIIANSSFSWWAAWLNNNKSKTVIAPQKWFNERDWNTDDLIPDKWIRI